MRTANKYRMLIYVLPLCIVLLCWMSAITKAYGETEINETEGLWYNYIVQRTPEPGIAESGETNHELTAIDDTEARACASFILQSPEIGVTDSSGMSYSIERDGDCWICEIESVNEASQRYLLVFDDSGCIHRFQDLRYELPEVIFDDYDYDSDSDDRFLLDADNLTYAWLERTRGWGYDAFFLNQKVTANLWLFSIEEMSEYVLVSRDEDDACTIRAYGLLTASHGAYGNGITHQQAIDLAARTADPYRQIVVLSISFHETDNACLLSGNKQRRACWYVVCTNNLSEAQRGSRIYIVVVDALSGDVILREYLGNGTTLP